jgi:hypothetical protein
MSTITADPTVQLWLLQLKDVTEIRDAQGNLLGIFTPKEVGDEESLYEKAKSRFDPVEMERRLKEEGGKGSPLSEVWTRIKAREMT